MSWLNFFDTKVEQKHKFGRALDSSLAENEEELFNQSSEAFEQKEILKAYNLYLKTIENFHNGLSNHNITVSQSEDELNFEIFQGSAKVSGKITNEQLYAESIITKKLSASVALKRYVLEKNYQMTYAYYFSDEEYIKLKISHDNTKMTPQKVFYSLRELAVNADFDKGYINSIFKDTKVEDTSHLKPLESSELKIKYDFMHKWITQIEDKILTYPSNDNSAMQSFTLLYLLFKIDYLITPKYDIYQKISEKIEEYFSDENILVEAKNEELREYIEKLKEMDFEEFGSNFYYAQYSFNQSDRASQEEIESFINESLVKIRWYKTNRYNLVIPIIYEYIALYILYIYNLHPVTRKLLHILVEIQNPSYFKEIGYATLYDENGSAFSKRAITSRIEDAISPYQENFKLLKPFGDKLNYTSLNEFSNSFYLQLKNLNFQEI
ncbi:MAG: hypothetical protein PHV22_00475 [Sulfurimonas sp.]|nr:hypothetical protein [Sulfurimonas sp.]